jgi:hypothetical protein
MAPIGFSMAPIFATGPILAASGNNDNSPNDGVPFGTALLIGISCVIGLFVIPISIYATVSSLIRCCKARRAQRQNTSNSTNASVEKNWTRRNEQMAKKGGANPSWPKTSRADIVEGVPRGTIVDWQTRTIASPTSPYICETTTKQNPVQRLRSILFPWKKKTTVSNSDSGSRDCEKETARGKETVEERNENIVAAFVGFLRSWARVEGNRRS